VEILRSYQRGNKVYNGIFPISTELSVCALVNADSNESTQVIRQAIDEPVIENLILNLNWDVDYTGTLNGNPWTISNNNRNIAYIVENSANCSSECGGVNPNIQTGVATANIIVGTQDVYMSLDFDGVGELQAPNYELITFYLDDVLLADAHAAGGGLGCICGPVIKSYAINSPYLLLANTNYQFRINFTTNDELFHCGCFYEVRLDFTPA